MSTISIESAKQPKERGASVSDEMLKSYCKGKKLKYLLNERKQNGLEDLKKAIKYLDWLIELEEIE